MGRRFNLSQLPREAQVLADGFVCEAIECVDPSDRDAQAITSRIAMLVGWCHSQGLEMLPEVVLHPDTIDRFIVHGCSHLTPGSQSNYRSVLHRIGASQLGPDMYPPRRLPLTSSDPVESYLELEERALLSWARGLSTPSMRDDALVVLSLGLGAGLTSGEMTRLCASSVEAAGAGIALMVEGPRARRIPVTARWEPDLRAATDRAKGSLLFRPDRTRPQAAHISRFVERLPRGDAPKLSTQRLRATWVVRHLETGVPINLLAVAAGVGPERLVRYARSMRPIDAEVADGLLRGEQA